MIQSSRLLCSGAKGEVCKKGIYSQIPENMVRNIMFFGYDTARQIWAHAVEAQEQTPAVFMRDCQWQMKPIVVTYASGSQVTNHCYIRLRTAYATDRVQCL